MPSFQLNTTVSEIYEAVHVDYYPRFELIMKPLKARMHITNLLQNRVNQLELKQGEIEREGRKILFYLIA